MSTPSEQNNQRVDPETKEVLAAVFNAAEELATATFDKMTEQDCIDMVRDYVYIFSHNEVVKEQLKASPITGMTQILFLTMLFPQVFEKSYIYSGQILEAKKSLEKAFKKEDN